MEQEASELMRGLSSTVDSEATIESLKGLMPLIERAHGATAEELAAALRRHGAVQRLCALVDDAAPSVHRRSMAILGNLVADVFDPRASESVALASRAGVLPRLLARLGDEAFPTKLYAAACLQNMTAIDDACCTTLRDAGCIPMLQALLPDDSSDVAKFAAGALANIQSKVGLGADSDEELHDVIDQRWRQEASDAIRAVVAAKRMQATWRAHLANVKARYPQP